MLRWGLSFFSLKRNERGFTLVELLIAMLITGIVASAAIAVFFVFIFHFEQTDELTTAQQNGEMVLTLLRNPVLHAGIGMPSGDLGDVFSPDLKGSLNDLFVDGPIVRSEDVGDGGGTPGGNVLLVLYGIPSRLIAENSGDLDEISFNVKLDSTPGDKLSKTSGETKNWALFPTAGFPLRVDEIETKTLTLGVVDTRSKGRKVATYDELYYLRGMRAYARKGEFYTEDLTLQSAMKRVENIAAVFFDHTGSLLKVWVIAAGPTEHDEPIYADWDAFKTAFPEWPDKDSAFEEFDTGKNWKYHRLRVLSESWRIRN